MEGKGLENVESIRITCPYCNKGYDIPNDEINKITEESFVMCPNCEHEIEVEKLC